MASPDRARSQRSPHVRLALVCLAFSACRIARPSSLPRDGSVVAVASCRLPENAAWIARFAQHGWIDAHRAGDAHWTRYEIFTRQSGLVTTRIHPDTAHENLRWNGREVRLLATLEGEEAQRVLARLPAVTKELDAKYRSSYDAWPGPNSNTFLVDVAREIPELGIAQHHNAVGKDYSAWISAGVTPSRTGVHLDTLPLGFAIGAQEGVELHLLQLTFGLRLFPPRIELPFLPELPWSDDVTLPERPAADICLTSDASPPGQTSTWTTQLAGERTTYLFGLAHSDVWIHAEFVLDDEREHVDATFTIHREGSERRATAHATIASELTGLLSTELCTSTTTSIAIHSVDGQVMLTTVTKTTDASAGDR